MGQAKKRGTLDERKASARTHGDVTLAKYEELMKSPVVKGEAFRLIVNNGRVSEIVREAVPWRIPDSVPLYDRVRIAERINRVIKVYRTRNGRVIPIVKVNF